MKKLKLEDYQMIKPYLDLANYEGYNSNFVTMMMWNHEYHIEYEIHDHYMVMLHNYKGVRFWSMPFTSQEYYQEAIDYMIQYSQEHQFEFIIDCAIEDFVLKIKDIYNDELLFERTPYNDDYIYDKKMLQTLSGKKMQKRRNHYNSFLKTYPHYVYRDLDIKEDFDTILNCLNKWETEKDGISESMTSEIYGIMYLLSSQHLLDFKVGGIFIDDVMEAFIIASRLNHRTIQIHVEKANKNIRGLYPAILKELLDHHFSDELYVNREEDMGLENLRKSKLSLHPIKMVHKYRITKKNLYIAKAHLDDQKEIMNLWTTCFKDETEQSTQYYFQYLYNHENTYVLKQNNRIISAIQIVPMDMMVNGLKQKNYFILGVCTHPYFQGQGYMKMLLNQVLKDFSHETIYLQAYEPQIYHSFGFHASHYHQKITLDKSILSDDNSLNIIDDKSCLKDQYDSFTSQFDEYRIRNEKYWELLIERCKAFDDKIIIFQDYGYMIYHEDEKQIYVSEIIYQNKDALLHMLNYFYSCSQTVLIECDMKIEIPGKKEEIITMMSNKNNEDKKDINKFINEIY